METTPGDQRRLLNCYKISYLASGLVASIVMVF
jgi:hypothetical protein